MCVADGVSLVLSSTAHSLIVVHDMTMVLLTIALHAGDFGGDQPTDVESEAQCTEKEHQRAFRHPAALLPMIAIFAAAMPCSVVLTPCSFCLLVGAVHAEGDERLRLSCITAPILFAAGAALLVGSAIMDGFELEDKERCAHR